MQKLSGKSVMTRGEILDVAGMDDNATFVKAMKELEQCDFIRKFTVIGKTYNAASLLFLSVVFAIKIAYKHQPKEVWRGSI